MLRHRPPERDQRRPSLWPASSPASSPSSWPNTPIPRYLNTKTSCCPASSKPSGPCRPAAAASAPRCWPSAASSAWRRIPADIEAARTASTLKASAGSNARRKRVLHAHPRRLEFHPHVSVTSNQLCIRRFESRYCHRTIDRHRLSKRLDTFDFVHRLS